MINNYFIIISKYLDCSNEDYLNIWAWNALLLNKICLVLFRTYTKTGKWLVVI